MKTSYGSNGACESRERKSTQVVKQVGFRGKANLRTARGLLLLLSNRHARFSAMPLDALFASLGVSIWQLRNASMR